jgi:hypothetical protein
VSVRSRDPLEPFATVVRSVTRLLGVFLVVGAISAVTSDDAGYFGVGNDICVDTGISESLEKPSFADELTAGVQSVSQGIGFCRTDPTVGQAVLQVLTELPNLLLVLSVLVLLWRTVGNARRQGPFSVATAAGVRATAWLLLLGGVVAGAVQEVAKVALIGTMAKDGSTLAPEPSEFVFAALSGVSPLLLFAGLGVLTVARILRTGVQTDADPVATA